ncbi:Testis-expressed protein 19.2 [Galemys pyrenaicus]|uniref:Testis-expressed protein 19.2 n=1 Tax=Galemys pyrenaicus TaxID=202257 RepID=A0A8J6A9W0_GALPY|nr:Testis-expressed protein 19.2 [Galemys pyrenaicus]KAG8507547.1 Testis-expressed protein 19.2 [Galemys pyrenaicus]
MCPPVEGRHSAEGVSHLYAAWLYQMRYSGRLRICFSCFKAAFLDLKDLLASDDWDDDDWDPELMDLEEAGSAGGGSPEAAPGWGQGAAAWGFGGFGGLAGLGGFGGFGAFGALGTLGPLGALAAAGPVGGLNHHFGPANVGPQEVTPLDLGPADADWTQGLPWRFGGLPTCSHWPTPYPSWQGFLKVDLPPGEPMVLELGTTRPVEPAEVEAWLLELQVVSLVGRYDAVYLRKMTVGGVQSAPGQRWRLLLEPDEVWVVRLQDAPQEQDLHRWKLSILESSPPGQNEELVPADAALLKRGFTVLSFGPLAKREAEEGGCSSGPPSSTAGQGPGAGGWGPGASLGPG